MDESLSLKFNTLENMKTVGNYEAELKKLYEENFELKHQVAYLKANQHTGQVDENIQKLLYDSKQSMDILENDNKNLIKQIENMKEVIRSSSSDKENLTNKLQQYENKINEYEEENDRLLNHLNSVKQKSENLNESHKGCELRMQEYEKRMGELTGHIKNLEADKELYFTEGKKLLDDCNALQNKINCFNSERSQLIQENENLRKERTKVLEESELERKEWNLKEQKLKNLIVEYENGLKQKNLEIEEIKRYYNNKKDLMNSQEHAELKSKCDKLLVENESLRKDKESLLEEMKSIGESYSNLKRRLEVVEDDKRALKYKISRYEDSNVSQKVLEEFDALKKAYERLKETSSKNIKNVFSTVIDEVEGLAGEVTSIQTKVNNLIGLQKVSEDALYFLTNLNIPRGGLNTIVGGFKKVYEKMKHKIDVLNNEIKDLTKFNSPQNNNNVIEIVKRLSKEFKCAREDLEDTKKYLEKKSKEIKELRKEKEMVEKKLAHLKERYNELKSKDNQIKESYNGMINKLKQKDDLLNKLEMKMFN